MLLILQVTPKALSAYKHRQTVVQNVHYRYHHIITNLITVTSQFDFLLILSASVVVKGCLSCLIVQVCS